MNSIILNKWFELINKSTSLKVNEMLFEKVFSPSKIDVYFSINYDKKIKLYFSFFEKELKDITLDQYVGLDFKISKMNNLSEEKTFLIVSKNNGFNEDIFLALVSSIYDTLTKQTDSYSFFLKLKQTLKKFKDFFEKTKNKLNQSVEIGLFGELLFLDYIIEQKGEDAIKYWMGPDKSKHDFEVVDVGYEVKSTLKQKNVSINIASEVQLEKGNLIELNLVIYTLEKNINGITLQHLANNLLNKLSSVKNKTMFRVNLLRLGFDIDNNINFQKYKLLKTNILEVNEDFPKITQSNIDKNVFDVKYKVNIDNLL